MANGSSISASSSPSRAGGALPLRNEGDPAGREHRHEPGQLIQEVGRPGVHHDQGRVGRLERIHDPRHGVLGGDRRQVDELQVHVLVGEHSRLGELGRERIGAGFGPGTGQPVVQGGLARVGRAEQGDLGGSLGPHHMARARAASALAAGRELLGELLDAGLDVGLEVLGPLVLWGWSEASPAAARGVPSARSPGGTRLRRPCIPGSGWRASGLGLACGGQWPGRRESRIRPRRSKARPVRLPSRGGAGRTRRSEGRSRAGPEVRR